MAVDKVINETKKVQTETSKVDVVTDIVSTITVDVVTGKETETRTFLTKDGKVVKVETK